jgi:DNA-binding transcriptional ArsR family regulator
VTLAEYTISELAQPYAISLAARAKHVSVLEKAGLITKRRSGKEKVIQIQPTTLEVAAAYLGEYEKIWSARFDALEKLLEDKRQILKVCYLRHSLQPNLQDNIVPYYQ